MDEIIMFRPLSQRDTAEAGQAVREIVKLQLHILLNKLEEKDIPSLGRLPRNEETQGNRI